MKTKSVLSLFAVLAVAGLSATAFADSIVVDGVTWNYTVNDGTTTVVLNGVDGNTQAKTTNPSFNAAHIPWTFTNNGTTYTVSSFGSKLFQDWTNLTGVMTIPGTVKGTLGVFQGCNGLTKLVLCEGIEEINWYGFKNCKYVTGGVVVPSSVTNVLGGSFSFSTRIGAAWIKGGTTASNATKFNVRQAFYGAKNLKTVLFGRNTKGDALSHSDKFFDAEVNGCIV